MADAAARLWWVIALPVAACLCAAVADARWLLVALMLIMLVAPFVMANVYFSRLLTTQARRGVLPKSLTVQTGSHIAITYLAEGDFAPEPETIPWSAVGGASQCRGGWVLEVRDCPLTGIIIPADSIISVTRPTKVESRHTSAPNFD